MEAVDRASMAASRKNTAKDERMRVAVTMSITMKVVVKDERNGVRNGVRNMRAAASNKDTVEGKMNMGPAASSKDTVVGKMITDNRVALEEETSPKVAGELLP